MQSTKEEEEPIQIAIILSKFAFMMSAIDDLISDIPKISPVPENAKTLIKELNDKLKWLENNMFNLYILRTDCKVVTTLGKQLEFAYGAFNIYQEWLDGFINKNSSFISSSVKIRNDVNILLKYIHQHDGLIKQFPAKKELLLLGNHSKITKMSDLANIFTNVKTIETES